MTEEKVAELKTETVEETVQDKPKKKATKPNWRPASMLGTLKARKGFTPRWVKADPANIAKKKAEGWIVMKPSDNIGEEIDQTDINDGKALHNGIRYRDHIAMMLPDETKKAREEYIREENKQQMAGILRDTDEQFAAKGVQTYKPKGQAGRIVID